VVPLYASLLSVPLDDLYAAPVMTPQLQEERTIETVLGVLLKVATSEPVLFVEETFKHAVQWGHLDANLAQHVERPRVEIEEMEIITPPEIRRLLDAADEPVRMLLLCAVPTGTRRGELLGLRWEDVDLEGNWIHVRRSVWRGKLISPKSRRSRRAIDLAPTLKAALTRLPSRFRGPSIRTTLDRYGHLMPELHEAEARKLDRLVLGPEPVRPSTDNGVSAHAQG
jgi:integrase